MQQGFAEQFLRCPVCRRERTLALECDTADEREVREGTLVCTACHTRRPVTRGVADLLVDPPDHIAREAAGLERFAERMRADGWDREKIRKLPYIHDGYWYVQGTSINQLKSTIPFEAGQTLLDIGSNTCWASNLFATAGLRVLALDITTAEMQGLFTADYFLEDGTSYFERVTGSMYDMPVASESLDYVYCCEVLHHNDNDSLRTTFEECFRVLKPGGRLLVINETLKTLSDPDGVHVDGVAEFEGYEHAHWAVRYRGEAIRAGFSTQLLEPNYHWFYRHEFRFERPPLADWRGRASWELRQRTLGRKLYLGYLNHVKGGASFGMIASKPRVPRAWGARQVAQLALR